MFPSIYECCFLAGFLPSSLYVVTARCECFGVVMYIAFYTL